MYSQKRRVLEGVGLVGIHKKKGMWMWEPRMEGDGNPGEMGAGNQKKRERE